MKKLISLTLALFLTACLVSCGNSDESSKTAELEKRVAELESQLEEQSTTTTTAATTTTTSSQTTTTTTAEKTTTTTTTAATTTPETTTTTAQTFDTSYYKYESSRFKVAKYDISLYAAPDKSSEALYNSTEGAVLEIVGEVNNDWEVALVDGNIVFVEKFATALSIETAATPEMYWFNTDSHIVHKDGCELISTHTDFVFTSDLDYALSYGCEKCELCFK